MSDDTAERNRAEIEKLRAEVEKLKADTALSARQANGYPLEKLVLPMATTLVIALASATAAIFVATIRVTTGAP